MGHFLHLKCWTSEHLSGLHQCSTAILQLSEKQHPAGCLQTFAAHGGPVNDITVIPQRRQFFLTASDDTSIRLWNLYTKCVSACMLVRLVEGHLVISCTARLPAKVIVFMQHCHRIELKWRSGQACFNIHCYMCWVPPMDKVLPIVEHWVSFIIRRS